jgi:hypothetical protein
MTAQPSEVYSDIMELQIADGLKKLLNDYGFTCEEILRIQSSELASILGVEGYIGKIIHQAAKSRFKTVQPYINPL